MLGYNFEQAFAPWASKKQPQGSEEYWESSQTSKMVRFARLVNCLQPLTIFALSSILYVWLGSECASKFSLKDNERPESFVCYNSIDFEQIRHSSLVSLLMTLNMICDGSW